MGTESLVEYVYVSKSVCNCRVQCPVHPQRWLCYSFKIVSSKTGKQSVADNADRNN